MFDMIYTKGTSNKNIGPCSELKGQVTLCLVFVSTPLHPWTKEAYQNFWSALAYSKNIIYYGAMHYGTYINIDSVYWSVSIPYEFSIKGDWYKDIVINYFKEKSGTLPPLYDYFKKKFNADSTPFLFVFNDNDRSYSYTCDKLVYTDFKSERAIIHADKPESLPGTIVHELLHLYGAIDLYYPDYVEEMAKKYCPYSIMLSQYYHDIDSLTSYLIGWNNNPDEIAIKFLEEIEKHDIIIPPKIK